MPTIHDVAQRAGVSIKTVSRVINREPYVRAQTQARVEAAMQELGYVANVSARRLASGRARAIGFVFHNPSWQYLDIALRSARLRQGVLTRGRRDGYDTIIHHCDADNPDDCRGVLELAARRSVDGFIFTPPCDVAACVLTDLAKPRTSRANAVPFVRITPRERASALPYVTADDRKGAFEMTRYLLALGRRRIGFILGSQVQVASHERLAGYREALAGADVPFDPALCRQGDFSFESGVSCGRALLEMSDRPTAIFASNDDMAAGVLATAHRMGVVIPDQLSVAGFDDTPLSAQVWPSLTTVAQPIHDIAVLATEILLRILRGERSARLRQVGVEHRQLGTRLVIRESTGASSLAPQTVLDVRCLMR